MKTIYELNEKDITTLVAERFDIGTECVQVSYDNTTRYLKYYLCKMGILLKLKILKRNLQKRLLERMKKVKI